LARRRLYPLDVPPGPNAPRYPSLNEAAENFFDLTPPKLPDLKEELPPPRPADKEERPALPPVLRLPPLAPPAPAMSAGPRLEPPPPGRAKSS
jgi:hypothetical protein